MNQLDDLYSYVYGETRYPFEEADYRLLEAALNQLMDIDKESVFQMKKVAKAALVSAIQKFQAHKDWPSLIYMLILVSSGSISRANRELILTLTVPKLASSQGHPSFLHFIDDAIEMNMHALLHITFVESGLTSEDDYTRAMATYALVSLPLSYWKETRQENRRAHLVERMSTDPSPSVRAELKI